MTEVIEKQIQEIEEMGDRELMEFYLKHLFSPFTSITILNKIQHVMIHRNIRIHDIFLTMNYANSEKNEESITLTIKEEM